MKLTFGMKVGRVLLFILRPIIYLLFPYTKIGANHIPNDDKPYVVCCNHISMVDPVFLLLAFKRPIYFMAKDSLFKNPFLGWFWTTLFGVFPVSRGKGDTGAVTKSIDILENGGLLGIFPEGTRSKDGKLGAAKSGTALIVAKTQASVFPCAVFTSDNKVRLFHKTTVVFGEPLTPNDLHLDGEKPDLRFASRTLMAAIGTMIEENRT